MKTLYTCKTQFLNLWLKVDIILNQWNMSAFRLNNFTFIWVLFYLYEDITSFNNQLYSSSTMRNMHPCEIFLVTTRHFIPNSRDFFILSWKELLYHPISFVQVLLPWSRERNPCGHHCWNRYTSSSPDSFPRSRQCHHTRIQWKHRWNFRSRRYSCGSR